MSEPHQHLIVTFASLVGLYFLGSFLAVYSGTSCHGCFPLETDKEPSKTDGAQTVEI